jgi:hypothetical protein
MSEDSPDVIGPPAPMPTKAEYIGALERSRTDLHGALVRIALEASGCPPDCSLEFHRWGIASILKIAGDALKRYSREAAPQPARGEG